MHTMDKYTDADDKELTLLALVKKEPAWAANVIGSLKIKLKEAEQRAAQAEREAVRECERIASEVYDPGDREMNPYDKGWGDAIDELSATLRGGGVMSIYEKLLVTELVISFTCCIASAATGEKTPDWLQAVGGLLFLVSASALPITILAWVWRG
jgi:hypothetical protein